MNDGKIIQSFWKNGKPVGIAIQKAECDEKSIFINENEDINQTISLVDD